MWTLTVATCSTDGLQLETALMPPLVFFWALCRLSAAGFTHMAALLGLHGTAYR